MRGEVLIKILLEGILSKFKTELYLRMPEDSNDFKASCKQLIISQKIFQNKKRNEEKELTAVIVGITHHEKHFMLERVPTRGLAAEHLVSCDSLFKGFLTPLG